MAESSPLLRVRVEGGVARISLNRPEKRNAFDERVAAAIEGSFAEVAARDDLRAVLLAGEGKVFCSGADLHWMRRAADYSPEENLRDARAFQAAYEAIDRCPYPVVGRIHGAALAGGAGLVAVCDVVVAAEKTVFGFPEVRVGLVPGVMTPYVVRKIGPGQARRLFLTGEAIDAREAWRLGLVHEVVPERDLDETIEAVLTQIAAGSPSGLRRSKMLVEQIVFAPTAEDAATAACEAIAETRASEEGREGTIAFLERRKPSWQA